MAEHLRDGHAAGMATPRPRYRREGGRTCIDVRVRSIEQIFDNRDPMPFLERDLDDEVAQYLTECATDIGREPLRVAFWSEASSLDEAAVQKAFRTHFDYELGRARRRVERRRGAPATASSSESRSWSCCASSRRSS
jgi:hypothetical protein